MKIDSSTDYESMLLKEIRELPEHDVEKVLKMVHFMKQEILSSEQRDREGSQAFWDSFGSWKDERFAKDIINEIYESRKSSCRDIQL